MVPKTQYPDIRVLLVEHHAHTASLYRFGLDDMGFGQLICAANTEEALDQMYFNAPGLVILGNELYPKTSPEFLAQIRAGNTGAAADVALVAICSNAMRAAVKRANNGGICEYVRMPVSMNTLCRHAALALKNHQQLTHHDPVSHARRHGVHQGKGRSI